MQLNMKGINNVKKQLTVEGMLWGTAQVNGSAEGNPKRARKRTIREGMKSELRGDWVFKQKENFKYPELKVLDVTRQIRVENHPLDLGIMRSLGTFATEVSMICTRIQGLKSEWEVSKWKENVD